MSYQNEPDILSRIEQNARFASKTSVRDITSKQSSRRVAQSRQRARVMNCSTVNNSGSACLTAGDVENECDQKLRIQMAVYKELRSGQMNNQDSPSPKAPAPKPVAPRKKKNQVQQ